MAVICFQLWLCIKNLQRTFLKNRDVWGLSLVILSDSLDLGWALTSIALKVSASDSLVQPELRTTTLKFKTFNRDYVSPTNLT